MGWLHSCSHSKILEWLFTQLSKMHDHQTTRPHRRHGQSFSVQSAQAFRNSKKFQTVEQMAKSKFFNYYSSMMPRADSEYIITFLPFDLLNH